jgi:hypothetical protein
MICKECQNQGLKSQVHPGIGMRTLMGWSPYYDENGKFHSHDPNTITTDYKCSNGHSWEEQSHITCWCGWPEKD